MSSAGSAQVRAKLRGFIVSVASGAPQDGVPIALWAEVDEGVERAVGLLTTDRAGYVSFDVSAFPSPVSFTLCSPQLQATVQVKRWQVNPEGPSFIGYANPRPRDKSRLTASMQNPDLHDLAISPTSFGLSGTAQPAGSCSGYTPAQAATRDVSILRTAITPDGLPDGVWPAFPGVRLTAAGDPLALPADYVLPKARMVHLRQQWWYIGSTLGDIVYSLPLAPGETVQLATIEWNRADRLTRTDQATAKEQLNHSLTHDRSLGETIDAALAEHQDGFSLMGGTSTSSNAGAAFDLSKTSGFPLNIAAGVSGIIGAAGSVAVSNGDRTLSADSTQTLAESINQSAWSMRSLNSTVVVQADQSENSTLQTRAVSNNNRCHALTVQYYEVLRTYRVETWTEEVDEAVMLPYADISFDADRALRYRQQLEPTLLDASLTPAFDAAARYVAAPEIYPVGPTLPANPAPVYASGRTELSVPVDRVVGSGLLVQKGSTLSVLATGNVKFGTDFGAGYDPDGSKDAAGPGFPAAGLRKYSLVCRVGNAWGQGGKSTEFVAADEGELKLQANDDKLEDNTGTWSVTVTIDRPATKEQGAADAPLPPWKDDAASPLSKKSDEAAMKLLVRHLRDNSSYYSRAVWVLLDASERRALLETYLRDRPDLLALIGDTPVSTFGKWLIFPTKVEVSYQSEESVPSEARVTQLVSLPSRGLLAEAELGSCNACEERDITRNANWPLPPPAPITGITPGPKGQLPTLPQQSQFPSPIVAIQQAPNVPDPVGLASALTLLGRPDTFRDMSGLQQVSSLLDDLIKGTVSETNAALRAASAKQALQSATGSGDGGGQTGPGKAGGSGVPSKRSAASTSDPTQQVDRLNAIQFARDKGQITEAQANDAALGVVGGEPIDDGAAIVPVSAPIGDVYLWGDLLTFSVPPVITDALRARRLTLVPIATGYGDLNLDYYPILVRKLPRIQGKQLDAPGLLQYVRLHLNDYVDTDNSAFVPLDRTVDTPTWESPTPAGAVLNIKVNVGDLLGLPPWRAFTDNALVVCAASEPDQWTFSTLRGDWAAGAGHPVSGNRRWAIGAKGANWLIYTMGADRATSAVDWGANTVDLVWRGAKSLWTGWQANVAAFINANGGKAEVADAHSDRYDWRLVAQYLNLPVET